MEFLELLFDEGNYLFSAAIWLMLIMAVLEGVLLTIGMGITSALNHFNIDIDVNIDSNSHLMTELFGWINKGRVPVIMLLVIFLTSFGLIGLTIQYFTGNVFSQWIIAIPAFFGTLPVLRVGSVILRKIIPSDESTAVSIVTLVGAIAEIVSEKANNELRAEAKVVDGYGYTHYVMVLPIEGEFLQGDKVVLLEYEGLKNFRVGAIINTDKSIRE